MEIAIEELKKLARGIAVCNLLLFIGLMLARRGLLPSLLGMALGNAAAVGNFILTGISAEQAVRLDPEAARRKMAAGYFQRMLMLAVVIAIGLAADPFDPFGVILPLFFPKISLTVGYIFFWKGGNRS